MFSFSPTEYDPKTHKVLRGKHSSATTEHYSPSAVVEAARAAFGGVIDFDPASTEKANRIVRARAFLTKKDDGLASPWPDLSRGSVWLNPPGSKIAGRSSQVLWWEKLVGEYRAGRVRCAAFLAFSIEFLQTSQNARLTSQYLEEPLFPLDFSFCVPRQRLQYVHPVTLRPQKSPPHASAIFFLPDRGDPESTGKFLDAFEPLGACVG